MPDIDLQNLTLVQVVGLACVITVVDVVAAIILAVIQDKFSPKYVAMWLKSHTAPRVFPIFAFAWIGHGVPQIDIPAIPPAFGLAIAGLTAYVVETIASVASNFRSSAPPPPPDETPVPA